jgi:hypothetical protein
MGIITITNPPPPPPPPPPPFIDTSIGISVQIQVLQLIEKYPVATDRDDIKYRLYINDDLITERSWIWGINNVIEERMRVEVSKNISHTLRLELIPNPGYMVQFGLRNFSVEGIPQPDLGGTRTQLSFILNE